MGYNGAPAGVTHCIDHGKCLTFGDSRCRRTIHAEANAIVSRTSTPGNWSRLVLYTTLIPCADCLKLAVAAGVYRVLYYNHREEPDTMKLLEDYNSSEEVIWLERFTPTARLSAILGVRCVLSANTPSTYASWETES